MRASELPPHDLSAPLWPVHVSAPPGPTTHHLNYSQRHRLQATNQLCTSRPVVAQAFVFKSPEVVISSWTVSHYYVIVHSITCALNTNTVADIIACTNEISQDVKHNVLLMCLGYIMNLVTPYIFITNGPTSVSLSGVCLWPLI